MSPGAWIRQVVRDLRAQRLRTLLTTLGIVWGTAAVSLLLAFGGGLQKQLLKSQAGLGNQIVITWPSLTSIPWEGLGRGRRIRLDETDMARIRTQIPSGLAGVSGEWGEMLKMVWRDRTLSVQVSGVEPGFGEMRNIIPAAGGRFLNVRDEMERRRVLFMGDTLAKDVFGDKVDPVGKTVLLSGSPFLVVGTLQEKPQDSSYGQRDTEMVWMPASTFRTLTGHKYVNNFIFQATDPARTADLKAEIVRVVAARHRFSPEDKEALGMWDTTEGFKFLETFMLAFRAFLGIIGALTLIVGGIGVSNVMNVVVEERTREIGIKMALGARPNAILVQFLAETLLITVTGGALGLLMTSALCAVFPSFGLEEYVGTPAVSPLVAGTTAALLGGIGLLAGWFPAREASLLDPAVAMKS